MHAQFLRSALLAALALLGLLGLLCSALLLPPRLLGLLLLAAFRSFRSALLCSCSPLFSPINRTNAQPLPHLGGAKIRSFAAWENAFSTPLK